MTITKLVKGLSLPLVLLVVWQWTFTSGITPITLSGPSLIGEAFVEYFDNGELFESIQISVTRAVIGLGFAILIGVSLGILMAATEFTNKLITPTFRVSMQISVFAWIPMISVWFGTTETSRILFIALVCIYPIALNTYQGFRQVPKAYQEAAKVLALSPLRKIILVLLPSAMPSVVSGIELGMLYAWLATIGAELLMGNGFGIGALMQAGQELFRMEVVFMGVVVCGAIGLLINIGAALLRSTLVKEGSGVIR